MLRHFLFAGLISTAAGFAYANGSAACGKLFLNSTPPPAWLLHRGAHSSSASEAMPCCRTRRFARRIGPQNGSREKL